MSWDRQITIKTPQEIVIMREAGRINAEALAAARAIVRPGVTTGDLNAAAEEVLKKYGCYSPFKGYPGPYPYPASTNVSVNHEMVHGIPGKRKLKEGDIVSVDCGTVYKGYVGDSAFTVGVGEISKQAQHLIDTTKQALEIAISQMVIGNRSGDVGATIEAHVESQGFYCTHTYTGHGVGRAMHEAPQLPNYGKRGTGFVLREGMTIAIEPMVLVGGRRTRVLRDRWTVVNANGGLTAHQEHTIAVTKDGPLVLTKL